MEWMCIKCSPELTLFPCFITTDANQLDGVLPAALCCLPCLETLSLAQNQLQGTIPQCLIDNSAVTMDLEENQLVTPTTADVASWP